MRLRPGDGGSFADYRRWAELRIEALNHALRGLPRPGALSRLLGQLAPPHAFDPPLADVVDLVLKVTAGYYLIEQANPRHEHEWALWEEVSLPEGSVLVPGVVTHHTDVVEHPELVAERLVRVAQAGGSRPRDGRDRLRIRPERVHAARPSRDPVGQARALVDGAKIASDRLWGAR